MVIKYLNNTIDQTQHTLIDTLYTSATISYPPFEKPNRVNLFIERPSHTPHMHITTHPQVYEPQEDSFLLAHYIDTLDITGKTVLDVGCGSGILSMHAAKKKARVTAIDNNPHALQLTRKNARLNSLKIKVKQSNLLQTIHTSFDIIFCNPPYLPKDDTEPDDYITRSICGGKNGDEYTCSFLSQASNHLKSDGIIYLIISSLSKTNNIFETAKKLLLDKQHIKTLPLFSEQLWLYVFTFNEIAKKLHAKKIKNIQYLDSGKRGTIYYGIRDATPLAIKQQLPQAPYTIYKEAEFLKKCNALGIGPTFREYTDDLLIRDFVNGQRIMDVLAASKTPHYTLKLLINILKQCRLLDIHHIQKQEMTNPYKHIIVSNNTPIFIDFERCSFRKNPSNVTQCIQWITSTTMTTLLRKQNISIQTSSIRNQSAAYKVQQTDETFNKILGHFTTQ